MSARRPLIVFGALLLGPTAILGALGFDGLSRERDLRAAVAGREAEADAARAAGEEADRLEAVRRRETARPYVHYQTFLMPFDLVTQDAPGFVRTPLLSRPEDPRVLGWFEWTWIGGKAVGPEVFAEGAAAWREPFLAAYGDALRARLQAAPGAPAWAAAAVLRLPLRTVAANEEWGSLLEQFGATPDAQGSNAYLRNFAQRLSADAGDASASVAVRTSPFAYLAAGGAPPGAPALVAWRLVWVPGEASKERRDAPVDRYLLQGYALAPAPTSTAADASSGARVREASVLARLPGVEVLGPSSGLAPTLFARAAPSLAALEATDAASRRRYLLVLAGLAVVAGVGFAVVWRAVLRETALARRKEDFVAAVTHELKTPLASIRMYADMLKEGWVPEGESGSDYAGRIVAETHRLGALVDQVLALAAAERRGVEARLAPGDLGESVRAAVALAEPASAEAGVPVRVEVADDLPLVPFDAGLVRQLVLNLVDNAVKYSARSPVRDVLVSVGPTAQGIEVAVADRGPGIPLADRARVFEPFFRSGREETRRAPGVGLGLALVRRYADAHGARVALESEEGRGTRISVTFPG